MQVEVDIQPAYLGQQQGELRKSKLGHIIGPQPAML